MIVTYFVYSPELLQYSFHREHPFNQKRLELTLDLIKNLNLISPSQIIAPRYATDEELLLFHEPQYVKTVQNASHNNNGSLASFGLGTEDTPAFQNMHEAASLIVGGTLRAAEIVMNNQDAHAVNLSGGLHHAFSGRASGFCVYNDCAVAIHYLRKEYDARVLYIDTDAHHGDGVQWAFYDDPNVLTLSIHETGKYLFPGTGDYTERGDGQGFGFSMNVPLQAYTEDDSFLEVYHTVTTKVARGFKPDVIITQNGCDSHHFDPLTHLSCSMQIYREIPRLAHQLAHELCEGRLIATGGGGYDIWRVVPRAWTWLWTELSDRKLENIVIPQDWIARWQPESPLPLPKSLLDPLEELPLMPRREEITNKNRLTMEKTLLYYPKLV